MSEDDPVELDREVLADPTGEDLEDTSPAQTQRALVPAGERALEPVDPFKLYVAEARRFPTLSREEETELARRYRETGDRDALFRLITANLMLVVRVALSFRRAARNLLDLVQEGNLGLLQAIDRYDPELGVRLPTYAGWWIRAYMVKFLLDNVRLVRVGTTNSRRKLLRNLRKERQRLEEQGYEVGPKLLAERLGVSEQDVKDVQAALSSRDVSLSEPVGEESARTRADYLPSEAPSVEEEVARRELRQKAGAAIQRFREGLNGRERAILDDRILSDDPLTLQALGDRFGTTREAVRQVESRLTARLQDYLRKELGASGQFGAGP
jgi:RNA polymerase sigma-32 factor